MKKGMIMLFLIMIVSSYIAFAWESVPLVKTTVQEILDPTLGRLLEINPLAGFMIILFIIGFFLSLCQKYLTDQKEMKRLREEQKSLQEEMKKYRDNPEKLMEFQKKQLEIIPQTFNLTLKPMILTSIPLILLYRWFNDYLTPLWGKWWIFYYLITMIFISAIWKKVLKLA